MKIHATRVPAPTVTQEHGTKWQIAVMLSSGETETYDRVVIAGPSTVVCLPENAPQSMQPRVWVEPLPNTLVDCILIDDTTGRHQHFGYYA